MSKSQVPPSKLRRRLGFGLGAVGAVVGVSWILVHSTSWAGPLFANGLRRVVGTDNVARLEDFVYGVNDRITRIRRRGEKPKAHWAVPEAKPKPIPAAVANTGPSWPVFEPKTVGPVHKSWSAPGDGQWVTVEDPRHPEAPTAMFKTLVHPDPNRSWGELFIVAIDLEQTDLHAAAGTQEPKAEQPVAKDFARPGRIPAAEHATLLAAFNGGFMAEHGHYGMLVNGATLIKPRETSCTAIGYHDGTVEIATWKSVAHAVDRMSWFRQTPACMYENNVMHVGLRYPETRLWGATLDGDTVIRRSAIGLDEARRILFVGIGNNMTARALAEGMHHAGAVDVAQLDVNWSYPKFLVYGTGKDGNLEARALMDGFEYSPGEYVTKSALRDFFYLTRRSTPRTTHAPAQSTRRAPAAAGDAGVEAVPMAATAPSAAPRDGDVRAERNLSVAPSPSDRPPTTLVIENRGSGSPNSIAESPGSSRPKAKARPASNANTGASSPKEPLAPATPAPAAKSETASRTVSATVPKIVAAAP